MKTFLAACLLNQLCIHSVSVFPATMADITANTVSENFYSIVCPGTIRSNFKYNVAVSVHKAEGPSKIEIGITGPSYNKTQTVEVQPMTTENVEFDIPKLQNGAYNLIAKGLSGVTFEKSTKLNYADFKPPVFIQTDKATYKPGDLVQFRVLFLDENTRPAKTEKPITIVINDGSQNRIKQLKDIKLTQGVFTGQFQLSEQPVLGNWNIEVVVQNENPEMKSFEVAKYVLPKFEVTIDTAKDIAIADGVVKITVRSKYTYGKSVKGKATVSVKPTVVRHCGPSNPKQNLGTEKTIDVDGIGYVEFDLNKDLRLAFDHSFLPSLKVLAIMEEELTGNKKNSTSTVNLHAERYHIEGVDTPSHYYDSKPVIYKVVVKNLDGKPVQNSKSLAKLIVNSTRHNFFGFRCGIDDRMTTERPPDNSLTFESKLNEDGIATFEFTLSPTTETFYSIKCVFEDSTGHFWTLSKYTPVVEVAELLKIKVNTEKPRIGKDVSFEVKSSEPIPYFVYTITARGNILKSEHVDVPDYRNSHTIKFTPTFEMIPEAVIYVHYVLGNNLRFKEETINFEKEFENFIDISTSTQAKPGEDVKLQINTDPESFVGLLGIDQSVLLLKSGNDLSKDQIFGSLNNFDTSTPHQAGWGRYPGETSGVVTLTNANYPYNKGFNQQCGRIMQSCFGSPAGFAGQPRLLKRKMMSTSFTREENFIRKNFVETWIYQDIENTGKKGFTLAKKIPDTITSWVITGFSLNQKTGFALTENPTKIQVFQPFFVSTNLPYSIKRGEVIAIPVIIFNYMDKELDAEVTMDNTDEEYEFIEATNEIKESTINEVKLVKRVTIPPQSGKSISFTIRPRYVGITTLKITANSPLAGDTIHQKLKVEPEGVTQYQNRAYFVNLKDQGETKESIKIDVPGDAVPDSEYIEFSVVGNLLGPTIKNIDKLVRMPYGCGEQNMVNFVPNILVLLYLEAINQSNPNIVEKAKKFLEIGYQRELTYKHDDGSYSAFGKSDGAGSTWLTAYVARSFQQATKFTDIDPKIIIDALDFLASKQTENGNFPEYGKLFDNAHQDELGLTSFTLLAFLENVENMSKYETTIAKGLQYVIANVDKSEDQYSLSITAVALQMAKNPKADKVLAKLQGLVKSENDLKWWSKEEVKPKIGEPSWCWRPRSNDVEITSYIALALLEKENPENILQIIKWLITQRNSNGGFSSTQDTVIGLQALIKFAEKTGSGNGGIDIDFVSTGDVNNKGTINVNPENDLVLQTHVLDKSTRQVDFSAKGNGSSLVQLAYRFNLAEKDKNPSFNVKTVVKKDTPPQLLVLDVYVEYIKPEDNDNKESNMAVLEIALPSGYTADTESFDKIENVDRVKRTETKNSDSAIIVYFDSLLAGDVKCIPVAATKAHAVAKLKPASVVIYDYYDSQKKATEYYTVETSLCDICEGEDCGDGCTKN